MKPIAIALATMLAAPAFPAPKLTDVTPETVCAWGPIASRNGSSELVVTTPAGPFTVRVSGSTKVVGLDGKELHGIGDLQPRTNVRVYYVVDSGARAREIDVIPASALAASGDEH